jgi:hypothetical protein
MNRQSLSILWRVVQSAVDGSVEKLPRAATQTTNDDRIARWAWLELATTISSRAAGSTAQGQVSDRKRTG